MIALDTNVLVRLLVPDDSGQQRAAVGLLSTLDRGNPGYVCREVAVELAWVLSRKYGFARAEIAAVFESLVGSEDVRMEDADDVLRAAAAYRDGPADFADLMILYAAERAGARPLYTFDRAALRLSGTAGVPPPEAGVPNVINSG